MSKEKTLYHVDLVVLTPVTVAVEAIDNNDAFGRAIEGRWRAVVTPDWDHCIIKGIGAGSEPVRKCP